MTAAVVRYLRMATMAQQGLTELIASGRASIAVRDWSGALSFLRRADAVGVLGPSDLEALAEAQFWSGHLQECIGTRERAYRDFVELRETRSAAMVALHLAFHHAGRGAMAVAGGWLEAAITLLADEPECPEQGWLAWIRGHVAGELLGDRGEAIRHADHAIEIGRTMRDRDVEALGMLTKGRAFIHLSRVDEGLAALDQVMGLAVSGLLGPWASAAIYCGTISTCAALGDYGRAAEWIGEVQRRVDVAACEFPGDCRLHRAEILQLRGDWSEAEVEVARACEELESWDIAHVASGIYELGMLSLRRGDVAAAQEAFAQVDALGRSSQPGRALVELTRGRPEKAWASLREALGETRDDLLRARLLPAATEAALQADDFDGARRSAEELVKIARLYPTDAQRARAAQALGEVEVASGSFDLAQEKLREAARLWHRVGAPYDEARARVALALVLRAVGDTDAADVILQDALSAFEQLGATFEIARVHESLGRTAPQARVVRTFMFTDIEDSTSLLARVGDERWSDVLRWHDATLRSLFARFEGQEIKQRGGGDGFFVAFKSAAAAIDCAIAIQAAMAGDSPDARTSLRVRIGVHEAEATRSADDYHGRGVHEAARIAALASGGEVLASMHTLTSAGSLHEASTPRAAHLKGLVEPVVVASVCVLGPHTR